MTDDELPLHAPEGELALNTTAEQERLALIEVRAQLLAFLDSPAGLMLRERAQDQKDAALAQLVKTNPTDAERIRALQGEVLRVDNFTAWLTDLLYAGEQAADTPETAAPTGD